jgi:MoaA/NifB/PqqE/SkfB family radical SAM enzyme
MTEQIKNQSKITIDAITKVIDELVDHGPQIARNPAAHRMLMKMADRWCMDHLRASRKDKSTPPGINDDKTAMSLAIVSTAERLLTEYNLSKATLRGLLGILVRDQMVNKDIRMKKAQAFLAEYGHYQPSFLTISPSKACNLRCIGCYADADAASPKLEWDTVDRIVSEAADLWGAQFMVISGGEPMAYRSQGKNILDLAEKHPGTFFMFYTNGTLITDEVAERMSRLGNITPAISLEGWRIRTDNRRGAGVFDKVMAAMDRLFKAGVPFGISLTATRLNAEEILSDDFIDMLFDEKHAAYGWIFQYMPIGRSYTLDLMPTPQQRLWMWRQSWSLIRRKRIFLADFWNHGTLVGGCLSAGGFENGGYFYIDWNGSVSPCVFVPYTPVNIHQIYAQGGNLNDIWKDPFFSGIRNWQESYKGKNIIAPCLIRDHNDVLRCLISEHEPDPSDENARAALTDPAYGSGLDAYSQTFQNLSELVWQDYYLRPSDDGNGHLHDLPDVEAILAGETEVI